MSLTGIDPPAAESAATAHTGKTSASIRPINAPATVEGAKKRTHDGLASPASSDSDATSATAHTPAPSHGHHAGAAG